MTPIELLIYLKFCHYCFLWLISILINAPLFWMWCLWYKTIFQPSYSCVPGWYHFLNIYCLFAFSSCENFEILTRALFHNFCLKIIPPNMMLLAAPGKVCTSFSFQAVFSGFQIELWIKSAFMDMFKYFVNYEMAFLLTNMPWNWVH